MKLMAQEQATSVRPAPAVTVNAMLTTVMTAMVDIEKKDVGGAMMSTRAGCALMTCHLAAMEEGMEHFAKAVA